MQVSQQTEGPSGRPEKIALVGAFDRFNYGDLLFPLVATEQIRAHDRDVAVQTFGAAASDLTRFGALKTGSIRALRQPGTLKNGDVVLFAGGGTLGADWALTIENLMHPVAGPLFYSLNRLLGRPRMVELSRLYGGGSSRFTWIAAPRDFNVPVRVAYNAVGGSQIGKLTEAGRNEIFRTLEKATYLSVRDAETKRLLASVEHSVSVGLAPDSATLISDLFPVDRLTAIACPAVVDQCNEEPYICLHANSTFIAKYEEQIVALANEASARTGLRIVLLPIGRYVGLDDRVGLTRLSSRIKASSFLLRDEISIFEIMLLIARASCFLGTSLHGNITAQSFQVPALALSGDTRNKVDHYLETWGLQGESTSLRFGETFDAHSATALIVRTLEIPAERRLALREALIGEVKNNFRLLAEACSFSSQQLPGSLR